ncbi:MAG TPA: class I SAM-dependent methyltransferase [Mycobacteriales bacterium]|nr:class I SAM-dependent methyltransferase [Mycobacteriales bacterium]
MTAFPEPALPEHVAENRAYWDGVADQWVAAGRRQWAAAEPSWGIWGVPQSELPFLPDDVAGLDTIELGCGTAYISAWLARRGARPVGIDNSARQLATARMLQAEHGLEFPLIHGNAERVPYPDGSFDLAVSEYGAAIWCDPYRWVPEAARLLRPGGRLVFLCNSALAMMCMPDEGPAVDRLVRPQEEIRRLAWPGEGIDFHLGHGEWTRLLRECGFVVDELIEVFAPATTMRTPEYLTFEWARRWPAEDVWLATRRQDGRR